MGQTGRMERSALPLLLTFDANETQHNNASVLEAINHTWCGFRFFCSSVYEHLLQILVKTFCW
jgi:hypothetical protein